MAWIPERDGAFVAAHADGNLYVYEKASIDLIINTFLYQCKLLLGAFDFHLIHIFSVHIYRERMVLVILHSL